MSSGGMTVALSWVGPRHVMLQRLSRENILFSLKLYACRRAGEGTSNFVVFDESIIETVTLNGKPVDKIKGLKMLFGATAAGSQLLPAREE